MTPHDMARKIRAENCDRDDMDSIMEAIGGLQSTDDPSLVPLEDELWERYKQLKAEKEKKNDE